MENSRRSFLKIAGISALGIGAVPVIKTFASSKKDGETIKPEFLQNKKALTAKRWGMVIDTRKLESEEDVKPIIEACHKAHNIPELKETRHEIKWIWEEGFENAFPDTEHEFIPEKVKKMPFLVLCNHCDDPPCVRACPTKATYKRESDGVVLMDFHRCIGCRFCMAACPYGSRSFNFVDPRPALEDRNPDYPTRMKGVVEKCNFCAERLAVGKIPLCVEASGGAIVFGDLDDPESEVRKVLDSNFTIRRKTSLGTGPSVFYIV